MTLRPRLAASVQRSRSVRIRRGSRRSHSRLSRCCSPRDHRRSVVGGRKHLQPCGGGIAASPPWPSWPPSPRFLLCFFAIVDVSIGGSRRRSAGRGQRGFIIQKYLYYRDVSWRSPDTPLIVSAHDRSFGEASQLLYSTAPTTPTNQFSSTSEHRQFHLTTTTTTHSPTLNHSHHHPSQLQGRREQSHTGIASRGQGLFGTSAVSKRVRLSAVPLSSNPRHHTNTTTTATTAATTAATATTTFLVGRMVNSRILDSGAAGTIGGTTSFSCQSPVDLGSIPKLLTSSPRACSTLLFAGCNITLTTTSALGSYFNGRMPGSDQAIVVRFRVIPVLPLRVLRLGGIIFQWQNA